MKHVINVQILIFVIGVLEKKGRRIFFLYSKNNHLIIIRCTPTFECIDENLKNKKLNEINICTNIERVIPERISLDSSNIKVQKNFDFY